MRALARSIRKVAKVWLFTCVVVWAALSLAQDARPAMAADAEIFFTLSTADPTPATSVILYRDDPTPVTLYVWARNIVDPQGLGGFEVDIAYDGALISANEFAEDTSFLAERGVSIMCSEVILAADHANVSCVTFGVPPPFGPQGDGLLATLTLKGGSQLAQAGLELTNGTFLLDTGDVRDEDGDTVPDVVVEVEVIPATLFSVGVSIARCADFDGDGEVTLFGDIFAAVPRFGMTQEHGEWNPLHDLNEDGSVDLYNDIFGAAMQFGMHCAQTT